MEKDYGYRCGISVISGWAGEIHSGKDAQLTCTIRIKKADEPFDIKKLASPAIHGAMEFLMERWRMALSNEKAMGKEHLKCRDGWDNWCFEGNEQGVNFVRREKDAIFVDCDMDIVGLLARLSKPVVAGIEIEPPTCGRHQLPF